jgi:TonB family protein
MSIWNETLWSSILVGAAVKSATVLVSAWVASLALRKHSAATRHLVWTAAIAAILALPFLSAALPVFRIPLAGIALPPDAAQFQATVGAPAASIGTQTEMPVLGAPRSRLAGSHPNWPAWLLLLWAAGALAVFARMLVAYAITWRMSRMARPSPDHALCQTLARTLGIRRPVDLLETQPGSMPVTFGMRRSVILMPADACHWSAERRRIVMLHELAHVRRGDAATHLMARAATAFYWWNPLVWTASSQLLKEGERAADDVVLHTGARASEYAGHLLEIARTMQGSSVMAWAAAGVARRSQLEGRLRAILDSGVNRTAPGRPSILAAVAFAVAIVAPLAAVRAQDRGTSPQPIAAHRDDADDVDQVIRTAQAEKNYETLDAAATAATRLGKYDAAQKLLEAALAIRAAVSGEQSPEYGVGLVKLAEVQQKIDPKSGGGLYAKAAQLLGDRPEAASALTHLGLAALARRDFGQAFEYFEHMQNIAPGQAGIALMWMAVVRQREKNMDEAERLFQSAMAIQDPHSNEAAVVRRVYAVFLREQGSVDRASELETRAAGICQANAKGPTAPAEGVHRVGNGVTAPVPLTRGEPQYSDEARAAKLQGTVVAQVVIGADGSVHDAQVIRELGLGLDENALEAISQWRFKPGRLDGQPASVTATIEVNYRLL